MSTANVEYVTVYAGSRLDEKQREAGISDEDLCRGADITTETLRLWKAGRYSPNASKLARMATILGCQVGDFFITRQLTLDAEAR